MKLYYHNEFNFGDALNPLLFDHFLPDFFDEDETVVFMGIGTIIGLRDFSNKTKIVYVFSSGLGYSKKPNIDGRCKILCVRGPLTAKALGIEKELAITDAGILAEVLLNDPDEKKYECSYIPHHYSEEKYDNWSGICQQLDIHFISPTISSDNSVLNVIEEIGRSKVVICEALHGAIIADSLRIPWIPVKTYKHINSFKWQDYFASMEIKTDLHKIPSIFSKPFLKNKLASKIPLNFPGFINEIVYNFGSAVLNNKAEQVMEQLEKIKNENAAHLSNENILNLRKEQLVDKLERFKK